MLWRQYVRPCSYNSREEGEKKGGERHAGSTYACKGEQKSSERQEIGQDSTKLGLRCVGQSVKARQTFFSFFDEKGSGKRRVCQSQDLLYSVIIS